MKLSEAEMDKISNDHFRADFMELQNSLGKFILKQTETAKYNYEPSQEFLKHLTDDWLKEDAATLVISFNYTDLFYGTHHAAELLYVHGSVKSIVLDKNSNKLEAYGETDTNNIVLGIDGKMKVESGHAFLYKSYRNQTNIRNIPSILNNAQRFILFGCSLGPSDRWYFERVFNGTQHDKTYEIYHFGAGNQYSINSRIEDILDSDFATFRSQNDFLYFDSSNLETAIENRNRYYANNSFNP